MIHSWMGIPPLPKMVHPLSAGSFYAQEIFCEWIGSAKRISETENNLYIFRDERFAVGAATLLRMPDQVMAWVSRYPLIIPSSFFLSREFFLLLPVGKT
jgi:hypothetical protein